VVEESGEGNCDHEEGDRRAKRPQHGLWMRDRPDGDPEGGGDRLDHYRDRV
jgi:hypothetical protein